MADSTSEHPVSPPKVPRLRVSHRSIELIYSARDSDRLSIHGTDKHLTGDWPKYEIKDLEESPNEDENSGHVRSGRHGSFHSLLERRSSSMSVEGNRENRIDWDKCWLTSDRRNFAESPGAVDLDAKVSAILLSQKQMDEDLKSSSTFSPEKLAPEELRRHSFAISQRGEGLVEVEELSSNMSLIFKDTFFSRSRPKMHALKARITPVLGESSKFYYASNDISWASLLSGSVFDDPAFLRATKSELQTLIAVEIKPSGMKLHQAPAGIEKLHFLRELVLPQHELSDLPSSMAELKHLELLDVSENVLAHFPPVIFQLAALKYLSIRLNKIKTLPDNFEMLSNLRELNAEDNHITAFPESLWKLEKLSGLTMARNRIRIVEHSLTFRSAMLSEVSLADNKMTEKSIQSLFEGLHAVRALSLAHCGIEVLPDAIQDCGALTSLDLTHNHLTKLPIGLMKLPLLSALDLTHNKFRSFPIPETLRLEMLQRLNLSHNFITSVKDLPEMPSLRNLNLARNHDLAEFHDELQRVAGLTSLDLSSTKIRSIPFAIRSMPYLDCLTLSFLKLSKEPSLVVRSVQTKHLHSDQVDGVTAFLEGMRDAPHPLFLRSLTVLLLNPEYCDAFLNCEIDIIDLLVQYVQAPVEAISREAIRPLRILVEHDDESLMECLSLNIWPTLIRHVRDPVHPSLSTECAQLLSLFCWNEETAAAMVNDKHLEDVINCIVAAQESQMLTELSCDTLLRALARAALTGSGSTYLYAHPQLPLLKGLRESPIEAVAAAAHVFCSCLGIFDLDRCVVEKRGVRVLALDGGGTKGVASLEMLRIIEEAAGVPLSELFDVIVGTSTGSIIAHMLGAKGFTPAKMDYFYRHISQKLFRDGDNKSRKSKFAKALKLLESKEFALYSAEEFEKQIHEVFGDTADLHGFELNTNPSTPKVAAVASLVSTTPCIPFIFRSYSYGWEDAENQRQSRYMGTSHAALTVAMRSSAAAPSIFPEVRTGHKNSRDQFIFLDGAMSACNPAAVALHEAKCIYGKRPIDYLVSIGCGETPVKHGHFPHSHIGRFQNSLIQSSLDCRRVHHALEDVLDDDCYFRFDPEDPCYGTDIDEWRPHALDKMQTTTTKYMAEPEQQARLAKLVQRVKKPSVYP